MKFSLEHIGGAYEIVTNHRKGSENKGGEKIMRFIILVPFVAFIPYLIFEGFRKLSKTLIEDIDDEPDTDLEEFRRSLQHMYKPKVD